MTCDDTGRTRRSYLRAAGAAALGGTLGSAGCLGLGGGGGGGGGDDELADEIKLFTWGGSYADDEWINGFEEKHGTKVTTEVYSSNADAINKIKVSPEGTYDLFMPTNYAVERAMKNDLVEPLNLDNVPAYDEKVFDALKLDAWEENGNTYAIPMVFGLTALMYGAGTDIGDSASLDLLWDEKYEGRISTRDNAKVQVFYAALKTGQDPNGPQDLDAIEEALKEHVKLVRTFWSSSSESRQVWNSGEIDLMSVWDGTYRTLQKNGKDVEYTGFEEGTKGWIDTWAIPKGAKHQKTAETFVNYCLTETARAWFEKNGYAIASKGVDYTDEEKKKYSLSQEALDSYIFQGYVSDDEQAKYDEMWTRIKASA